MSTEEAWEDQLRKQLIERGEHPTRVNNPLYSEEKQFARDYLSAFKSALREEIEKEKVKRGQPSEDLEVGKIIGLQIALQLLDSIIPKK